MENPIKHHIFSEETIAVVAELGEVLQTIHRRLAKDGGIINGQFVDNEPEDRKGLFERYRKW